MFYFADYRKLVLLKYMEKRAAKELSLRLTQPTPRKLKDECAAIVKQRFHPKDQRVLYVFFGSGQSKRECLQAIEDFNINKFKPLLNFIKGSVSDPDAKHIELLAWLIDFEPRPFDQTKSYDNPESIELIETIEPEKEEEEDTAEEDAIVDDGKTDRTRKSATAGGNPGPGTGRISLFFMTATRKKIFLFGGVVLPVLIIAAIYWFSNDKHSRTSMSGTEGCMYWSGDHYQPIPCTKKMGNKLVIALDTMKVRRFRKITRPDTITRKDKGYVWYSKIDNNVEFYTSPGNHPVQIDYHLKPITDHIIDIYCK